MNVSVTEPGYIYAWVSNTSENTKVWSDDFSVAHTSNFVTQATDYGAWGDVLREQKTNESIYRYSYQGQFAERDLETGWNHFELREYDPVIGRTTTIDPARQFHSPYLWTGNNPIRRIDPTGGVSPIYDMNGIFLRTDDQGLQGEAIFMDASQFTQGMSHESALEAGFTFSQFHFFDINLSAEAEAFYHMETLPNRPDWDGVVTDMEARAWWSNGNGVPLYVDRSQFDLTPITTAEFYFRDSKYVNFFYTPRASEIMSNVYGTVKLTLKNPATGRFELVLLTHQ